MWQFWLMFLVALAGVLSPNTMSVRQAPWLWAAVGAMFAVTIGLRHEVGGDWFNYSNQFYRCAEMSFAQAAAMPDPGHYVLSRWVARSGGEIYAINFMYACVVMIGTVVFCRRQPEPWLALLVAVPYMLIVVGMGYTRQSVALGFALLGLVALRDGRVLVFLLWVGVGALFHRSAVLLLPIAALAASRNKYLTGVLVLTAAALMYSLLLEDTAEQLWNIYIKADVMQSSGGAIRVAMNVLPAILLLRFPRQLVPDPQERKLWVWMALFALSCVPLVLIASTAVDRVALYLIPLQLFVFSRVPWLAKTARNRGPLVAFTVVYYAVVQFVWLNFATHATFWVPYEFMPSI
jgi:hypothetical protein